MGELRTRELIYNPYDPALHDEYPAALYRALRTSATLYRSAEHDFWALTRFAEVQSASRDHARFSSAGPRGVDLDGTGTDLYGTGNFLELDPPLTTGSATLSAERSRRDG